MNPHLSSQKVHKLIKSAHCMNFIPFNCRWIMTPLIWIDTKEVNTELNTSKQVFSFHPRTDRHINIGSRLRGSNGFDYFNIFDYFMNERITTVTFVQSKESQPRPERGRSENILMRSDFRIFGCRENWFYFSINASEFFFAVRSGNSIKALSVPLSIRLSVDAAMRVTKSNLATDDYSIFFTQKLFYFVEALQM